MTGWAGEVCTSTGYFTWFAGASEQRRGLPEPGALTPADVIRHRRLLAQDALGPFSSLRGAPLRSEEATVVVLGFRQRRRLRDLREECVRPCALADLRKSVGVEAGGALIVVLRVTLGDVLEVGGRGGVVVQRDLAESSSMAKASIERIREDAVSTTSAGESGRRGRRASYCRPMGCRESRLRAPLSAFGGENLNAPFEAGRRRERPLWRCRPARRELPHQDDKEPVCVGPSPHKMQDRNRLQEEPVGVEKAEHTGARYSKAARRYAESLNVGRRSAFPVSSVAAQLVRTSTSNSTNETRSEQL